jgi:hypothetical protein
MRHSSWFVLLDRKTRIYLVKCHKHLGITLSADCKWSNHINTIIEKTFIFTMLHKLFISYDFPPMDVSSANNLHNPIVSSAMSLINIKKRRGPRMDPCLKITFRKTRIYLVKCHKHLGITLSADCKWSNHINTIIEKTFKQVAILRKLKFKVS